MSSLVIAAAASIAVSCAAPPQDFRTFYAERYPLFSTSAWFGMSGERYDEIFRRLANAVADYADYVRDYQLMCRSSGPAILDAKPKR